MYSFIILFHLFSSSFVHYFFICSICICFYWNYSMFHCYHSNTVLLTFSVNEFFFFWILVVILTLFRMGLFGSAHRWLRLKRIYLDKICLTHPAITKLGRVTLYLKKIKKSYKSRHTLFELCWYHYFSTGNQQLLLFQKIQI